MGRALSSTGLGGENWVLCGAGGGGTGGGGPGCGGTGGARCGPGGADVVGGGTGGTVWGVDGGEVTWETRGAPAPFNYKWDKLVVDS